MEMGGGGWGAVHPQQVLLQRQMGKTKKERKKQSPQMHNDERTENLRSSSGGVAIKKYKQTNSMHTQSKLTVLVTACTQH